MCGREFGGKSKRALGRCTRLGVRLLRRRALEECLTEAGPGPRQPAPGERITGIKLSRLRVELDRLAKIRFRVAGNIKRALQKGVVGLQTPTRGPLDLRRRVLTGQELRPQRARHRTGDLIL